ncbi:MAG TPA: lysine-sensitive aspartokinase 3 [Candidatus Saccharimonadales bacterium]|jgi:aspartate kinase|nr:lysine-sensitive aspartokinase 3 [Candidatus Saccharimonadales bacterium]
MIVMKFGGTSVQDSQAIDRIAEIVRERLPESPVVVVSALAKITDQLLAMAAAAGAGDREKALELARAARERHFSTASELLGTSAFAQIHPEMEADFDALDDLLRGIVAVGELTLRSTDNVAGLGERVSSKIVAAAFSVRGINASAVDSRQCLVTDANYTRAIPQFEETNARLVETVKPLLNRGRVPVMGGFIGATREGVPTTLGRGGSDFTAAIIGAGLGAERIEIWTDVDGMMTTDPNLCPNVRRIKTISFQEAAELAYFGAKVLHPATLLPAIQKNIPVLVLNSRNPKNEGTRITATAPRTKNLFMAIAAKKRITVVDVVATRMLMAHGFLKSIFEVFAQHRCPVDMVSTSEVSVSVTVDSNESIAAIAADLARLADVKYEGRKAIVCLVGENIRSTPGIAAKVFGAIPDVSIHMISQGASEINISFVIDESDVPQVVSRLHHVFFSQVDPEVFA